MFNDIILNLVQSLSYRLRPFGIYDREDLQQEMYLVILREELLSKYDEEKGSLEAYLSISLMNRMRTLRRDFYLKSDRKRPFNDALPITAETFHLLTYEGMQETIAICKELRSMCLNSFTGEIRMLFLRYLEGFELPPSEFRRLIDEVRAVIFSGEDE